MKKVLIGTFKVLFWAYFVYSLGLVQGIVSLEHSDSSNPYDSYVKEKNTPGEDRWTRDAKMFQFYRQKVEVAEKKTDRGEWYSPYDYFTDMRDVNEYRKVHGVNQMPIYAELQRYMDESVRKGPYSYKDIEKAREIAFPGITAMELEASKNAPTLGQILTDVGLWCLALYMKMLPLVFLLFLVWLYEQNGKKGLRLRNPFSFLISLLFHPIVIFLAIREYWSEKGRSLIAEAQIRRMKERVFSLLTKDEITLVHQFTKKHITYKEFKVKVGGTVPCFRYSFILALMITLIMYCVPRSVAIAAVPYDQRNKIYQVTNSYEYFSGSSMERCVAQWSCQAHGWSILTPLYEEIPPPLLTSVTQWYRRVASYLLPRGHVRCIEHVPLMVNSFFMQVKQFVNQKLKRYEHTQSTHRAFPYSFRLFQRTD